MMRPLPLTRRRRAGFTLIEVMVASAILGLSLVVMFGFHSQAVRSNMNAHRMTDCTYLAQSRLEQLLAEDWTASSLPTDLQDLGSDASTVSEITAFEHVDSTVNAAYDTNVSHGPVMYQVSWDVQGMGGSTSTTDDWLRLRVRCIYPDAQFNTSHSATISSYRFRDSG